MIGDHPRVADRQRQVTHRRFAKRRAIRRRTGAATLEFAFAVPVLFLMVFAAFQLGGMMLIQNALTAAAREGSRMAALSTTSSSDTVVSAVEERLQMGGVDPENVTVVVSPTVLNNLDPGTEVRVTVSGQISQLGFFWPDYLTADPTLSAEMTYHRE